MSEREAGMSVGMVAGLIAIFGFMTGIFSLPQLLGQRTQPSEMQTNSSAHETFDPKAMELAYWKSIAASNDSAVYEQYLRKYPNGEFASVARAKLRNLQASRLATERAPQVATRQPATTTSGRATVEQSPNGGDKNKRCIMFNGHLVCE